MTLNKADIVRVDEAGGKNIRTFTDTNSRHNQGVAVVDAAGDHTGIAANPLHAQIATQAALGRSRVITSEEVLAFSANFSRWVDNRYFAREFLNVGGGGSPGFAVEKASQALFMDTGLASGTTCALRSHFSVPVVMGYGQTAIFRLRFSNISSPVADQKIRWGLGDQVDGVFIEWSGTDQKLRLVVYNTASEDVDVDGDAWDVPVEYNGGAGLLTLNPHTWSIVNDWVEHTVKVYLDGVLVHTAAPDQNNPLPGRSDLRLAVEATNEGNMGLATEVRLHGVAVFYEGSGSPWSGQDRYYACAPDYDLASASDAALLHLHFRESVSGDFSVANQRVAHIRKVRIDARGDTTGADTDWMRWSLRKSVVGASGAAAVKNAKQPIDPDTIYSGYTPTTQGWLSAALGSNPATFSGYGNNDDVVYKVTALGARGETTAGSFVTSSINVTSPAQSVLLTLTDPIPWATAYRIYREVNGSGNFHWIADVDAYRLNQNFFEDFGYAAVATTPPADNADHASFMEAQTWDDIEAPTGGNIIHSGYFDRRKSSVELMFDRGDLIMIPGETLAVVSTDQAAVDWKTNVTIEWEEVE